MYSNTLLCDTDRLTWIRTRLPATARAAGLPTLQNRNPEQLLTTLATTSTTSYKNLLMTTTIITSNRY